MDQALITRYTFNAPSGTGLEVKGLDYLWAKAELASQLHRASFYHLLWVQEGQMKLMLDFQELCLQPEEALVIAPGQVCRFHLEGQARGYSLLFVPEFLGEAASDTRLLHRLTGTAAQCQPIISLQGLPIEGLIHELVHELTCGTDEYMPVIARSCLRILLAETARRLPASGETSDLATRFFDEVEQHYQHLYNVSDYLERLLIPEKSLTAAVRSASGLTPKAYIDQRRLLEAKRTLAYSDQSVKEVAFALGFDEPTNFNKFFKKHTHLSPNEFRIAQQGNK